MSDDDLSEVDFLHARRTGRTYLSKSFPFKLAPGSRDFGHPARYVRRVFDHDDATADMEMNGISIDPPISLVQLSKRRQVTATVARDAGGVRELLIEKVTASASGEAKVEVVLRLRREQSSAFLEFMRLLEHVPPEGGGTVQIDDELIQAVLRDPSAVAQLYREDPDVVREMIARDANAGDVVAIAGRRAAVAQFESYLHDPAVFEAARQQHKGPERVWQHFFEKNPWILGVGLSEQLLTSWDDDKLEQVVAGQSIGGPGKRSDAVMRTNGAIRSMVLAEIKPHYTELVEGTEYRSGCHSPSKDLVGGVTQVQQTVSRAVENLSPYLPDTVDGYEQRTGTYLVRPRSFLVIGRLDSLQANGATHVNRYRSFELYRRNLVSPEVVTYDELLAKARWMAGIADPSQAEGQIEREEQL